MSEGKSIMVTLNTFQKPSWPREETRGKGLSKKRSPVTPSLHSLLKKLSLPPRRVLWRLLCFVEEGFSFQERNLKKLPSWSWRKTKLFFPYTHPLLQSYEVTSDLLEQGGEGIGEEVYGRWGAELRGLELINYFKLKGLSMGKARATMGLNRGQEMIKNKQEERNFRNAHFSRREFLL